MKSKNQNVGIKLAVEELGWALPGSEIVIQFQHSQDN